MLLLLLLLVVCGCAATHAVLPDAGSYRDICIALRQEHDREVLISQQLQVRAGVCSLVSGAR